MAPKIRMEKEVWLFPFSLITLSGRNQLPCREDVEALHAEVNVVTN